MKMRDAAVIGVLLANFGALGYLGYGLAVRQAERRAAVAQISASAAEARALLDRIEARLGIGGADAERRPSGAGLLRPARLEVERPSPGVVTASAFPEGTVLGVTRRDTNRTTNMIVRGGLFYDAGSSATPDRHVALPARPPIDARWHVVSDTYYDGKGAVVGREAVAHRVDPDCHPGRREDLVAGAPQAVRQQIAEAARVEPAVEGVKMGVSASPGPEHPWAAAQRGPHVEGDMYTGWGQSWGPQRRLVGSER